MRQRKLTIPTTVPAPGFDAKAAVKNLVEEQYRRAEKEFLIAKATKEWIERRGFTPPEPDDALADEICAQLASTIFLFRWLSRRNGETAQTAKLKQQKGTT